MQEVHDAIDLLRIEPDNIGYIRPQKGECLVVPFADAFLGIGVPVPAFFLPVRVIRTLVVNNRNRHVHGNRHINSPKTHGHLFNQNSIP